MNETCQLAFDLNIAYPPSQLELPLYGKEIIQPRERHYKVEGIQLPFPADWTPTLGRVLYRFSQQHHQPTR